METKKVSLGLAARIGFVMGVMMMIPTNAFAETKGEISFTEWLITLAILAATGFILYKLTHGGKKPAASTTPDHIPTAPADGAKEARGPRYKRGMLILWVVMIVLIIAGIYFLNNYFKKHPIRIHNDNEGRTYSYVQRQIIPAPVVYRDSLVINDTTIVLYGQQPSPWLRVESGRCESDNRPDYQAQVRFSTTKTDTGWHIGTYQYAISDAKSVTSIRFMCRGKKRDTIHVRRFLRR